MPAPTIMFDCDGVLIDSEVLVNRIHVNELVRLGIPVSEEELLQQYCGVRDDEMVADLERTWNVRLPADYLATIAARTSEAYPSSLTAIAGVADALDRLPMPKCVVSSSSPRKLRLGLDVTGLSRFFEPNIFSGWSVQRGKPAPDVYLYAAEQMGAQPADCIVVEDSVAGVRAGIAAGMTVLAFTGGGHCLPGHDRVLIEYGAVEAFRDMHALPALIENVIVAKSGSERALPRVDGQHDAGDAGGAG